MPRSLLASTLLLLPMLHGAAGCAEYTVHLAETYRVGDTITVEASGHCEDQTLIKSGGNVLQKKQDAFDFSGKALATITTINERGQLTAATLHILALSKTTNGQTDTLLAAGTEVVVGRNEQGRSTFTIGGQAVDKGKQQVLDKVFTVRNTSQPSDDECFGPGHPVQVGDAWPVNAASCAKALAIVVGGSPTPDLTVDGTYKLAAVADVGSVPCASITGTVTFDHMPIPLPPGLKADQSHFVTHNSGTIPLAGGHYLEETESFDMSIHATGTVTRQGADMPLELTTHTTGEVKRTRR